MKTKLYFIYYEDGMCESHSCMLMRGPKDADIAGVYKEYCLTNRNLSFHLWLSLYKEFQYVVPNDPEITYFNEYDGMVS
jgi:hypothetical protein